MNYYGLTTPQKNIFLTHSFYEGTAIANICGAVFYNDNFSVAVLRKAVEETIKRHDVFRLRLSGKNHGKQYFAANDFTEIPVLTFADEKSMNACAGSLAKEPVTDFDVPLYRFFILHLKCEKEEKSGVLAVLSHLISDAWSFALLAREIGEACNCISGKGVYTPAKDRPDPGFKSDYLEFIREDENYRLSDRCRKDRLFWKERYDDFPERTLIRTETDKPDSIEAFSLRVELPDDMNDQIRSFCGMKKITPAVLFETAVMVYLSFINLKNKTLTIGVPVLNRSGRGSKNTVGMFISTVPLTVGNRRDGTVGDLMHAIVMGHRAVFRHQRYPYSKLLREARKAHGSHRNLYDVMVSVQNAETKTEAQTRWYFNGVSENALSIHIDDRDCTGTYSLTLEAQKELFPQEDELSLLAERLFFILRQILKDPERLISEISILPEDEYKMIVSRFNDTRVDYPREKCVHELFEEQVKRTPDQTALVFEDRKFSFRQLDQMSNSLAYMLRKKGVKRNEVIPVIARRDWKIMVAILGIMKAGGGYMPISPDYPSNRMIRMVETAKSRIALCISYSEELPLQMIDMKTFDFTKNVESLENVNESSDFCCVIFTSGSTGVPKAAALTHMNLVNYICEYESVFSDVSQTISATIPVFDAFLQDTIVPLCHGKTVVLANEEQANSPSKLWELVNRYDRSFLFMTPTKWQEYLRIDNSLLRESIKIFCGGGEALSVDLCNRIEDINPDGLFINGYGPCETTIESAIKIIELSKGDITAKDITIGKPIANTQIYILNEDLQLLPIGVAGELCIAGDGVGKGYMNQPELTAERFVPNPFAAAENGHGKVMYRTGDLACWRMDGEIEYFGRIDTQVKIRGLRIELGEIESIMAEIEGTGLVAAAAKRDEEGRQYLVGYYTSDTIIDERAMRKHLSGKLPKYMVPNYFMKLGSMPMTPSGKTDRKNLPVPDITIMEREYVPPVTDLEIALCEIMGNILSVKRFGITDNFFDLGGDSLAAINVIAMAHERDIDIGLQMLFDYPDVRELCLRIEDSEKNKIKKRWEGSAFIGEGTEKYVKLLSANKIDETHIFQKKEIGNVLLTGATGFLGAHILDALMKSSAGRIYCLVRKEKADSCRGRLEGVLTWYFGDKYTADIGQRIIPIEGNIEREDLSDELPKDVQTVIHTAATVKHYGVYDHFRRVNIEGTRHVADYARQTGAELIHISTISVSGNPMADDGGVYRSDIVSTFDESCLYVGQSLDNVYIRSKYEAERVVLDEMLECGLQARIIRVGNLTNRASDQRFQPNYESNAFLKRLKAILELGKFPDSLVSLNSEFSPVDLTAEGIVKIAEQTGNQTVFHLYNNKPLSHEKLLTIVNELGIQLEVVSGKEFSRAVEETLKDKKKEHIYRFLENDMNSDGEFTYNSNIHIVNDFTVWYMSKIGFEWNTIDINYVREYINYFREVGYLNV